MTSHRLPRETALVPDYIFESVMAKVEELMAANRVAGMVHLPYYSDDYEELIAPKRWRRKKYTYAEFLRQHQRMFNRLFPKQRRNPMRKRGSPFGRRGR